MAAFGPNPLPPTQVRSSHSISPAEALSFLSDFLTRAAYDPALQPNAMITQDGPKSRTTADAPNLTLHNLKRIQKSLEGEVLGSDLALSTAAAATKTAKSQGANTTNGDTTAENNEGQWEDKEQWELGQESAISDGAEKLNNAMRKEIVVDDNGLPIIDKEERKRAKKERRKAEKLRSAQKKKEEMKMDK